MNTFLQKIAQKTIDRMKEEFPGFSITAREEVFMDNKDKAFRSLRFHIERSGIEADYFVDDLLLRVARFPVENCCFGILNRICEIQHKLKGG